MSRLTEEARAILAETLRQIDVRAAVARHVVCEGGTLVLGGASLPVDELDEVAIVAVGKAALAMYEGVQGALRAGACPPIRAVIVTNQAAANAAPEATTGAMIMPGSHPLPDDDSLAAAGAVLSLLRKAGGRTAVVFLISGGASAMIEAPLDLRVSMADTAASYQALIGSGLPIAEMNALRKHLSAVKGGRLAQAAAAARIQYTLLISDVPWHLPDAIGSGPSLPDSTTLEDCRALLARLRNITRIPVSVEEFFEIGRCVETPKPVDAVFDRAHWDVVLSSEHLADAAARAARGAGFHVEVDNACDEWEYRDAARYLVDRGSALAGQYERLCLISVGEVGVALSGEAGEGGRNQQFALWCAAELARRKVAAAVLSFGSDGIDGNSRAAGAICDETTAANARRLGMSVEEALAHFNTTPLLRTLGATIETGPTGNNLRDLRLLLFG